jgi:hypothetical protein
MFGLQFFLVSVLHSKQMLDTPVCSGPASAVHATYLASTEPMEHRNDVPEANGPPKFRASQPRRVVLASSTVSSTRHSPAKPQLHREKLESEKDESS